MTDLIKRAKAVAERLGEDWLVLQHPQGNVVKLCHPDADEAAAIIRELIARVEAMGPIAGEG